MRKKVYFYKVRSILCGLPLPLLYPAMCFLLLLPHKPYGRITDIYWNMADHTMAPEFWWDIQDKYKTDKWK